MTGKIKLNPISDHLREFLENQNILVPTFEASEKDFDKNIGDHTNSSNPVHTATPVANQTPTSSILKPSTDQLEAL